MSEYRFISSSLTTGQRIADVAVEQCSYTLALNSPGEFTAALPIPTDRDAARAMLAATEPGKTVINILRDGQPVGSFIVWGRSSDGYRIEVAGAGVLSYLSRRFVKRPTLGLFPGRQFFDEDIATIISTLVEEAQEADYGNIGLELLCPETGILLDYEYLDLDYKPVMEAILDLAALDNGPDLYVSTAIRDGAFVSTLQTYWPFAGRTFPESGVIFRVAGSLTSFRWEETAGELSNRLVAIGSGLGDGSLIATAQAAPGEYPLFEATYSVKDYTNMDALEEAAKGELKRVSQAKSSPTIQTTGDYLGFELGDECLVSAVPGDLPRFPDGLSAVLRIVGYTVAITADGKEDVSVELSEPISDIDPYVPVPADEEPETPTYVDPDAGGEALGAFEV